MVMNEVHLSSIAVLLKTSWAAGIVLHALSCSSNLISQEKKIMHGYFNTTDIMGLIKQKNPYYGS